jgi:hypothetical protein
MRNDGAYKPASSAAFDAALSCSNVPEKRFHRRDHHVGSFGAFSRGAQRDVLAENRGAANLTNVYML